MASAEPSFEARPSPDPVSRGWCVYVNWPTGKTDVVAGFRTQYDALTWIKTSSANWVVEQIMRGPD